MNLKFKEWFILEAKRKLQVHPDMKRWVASVEGLEKDLETLKAVLKNKKPDDKKDVDKKINVLDKKLDTQKDKKPDVQKPEVDKKPDMRPKPPVQQVKKEPKPNEKLPDKKEAPEKEKSKEKVEKKPIEKPS